MRRFSILAVLFLVLCAGSILLMRSCGGDRSDDIPPLPTPEPIAEATPTPDPMSLVATPEPLPTPVPTPSYEGKVWTTDGVNLRLGPGTEFDIFNAVDKGTELQRTGMAENGWSIVQFNGAECYVSSTFISTTPPSTAPDTTESSSFNVTPCNDTVWTTDGMNLRRGPGTEYDVGVTVEKGTELQRNGTTDNNWSRVLYNSVGYYVDSSYLTTTPPTPEEGEEGAVSSTPESTAAPVVSGDFPTEGSFESNTGVALNVRVDWNVADNGDGSRTLNLSATLLSCTLEAVAYADDLCFKVGNDTFYVTSKGVSVNSASMVETPLGSCSATVDSIGVPVTVSWRFNGSYSGQQIEYVTATQTLTFGS